MVTDVSFCVLLLLLFLIFDGFVILEDWEFERFVGEGDGEYPEFLLLRPDGVFKPDVRFPLDESFDCMSEDFNAIWYFFHSVELIFLGKNSSDKSSNLLPNIRKFDPALSFCSAHSSFM